MKKFLCLVLVFVVNLPAQEPFTRELWRSIEPIYSRILEHPFLTGLSKGTLPRDRFEFYMIQDTHYLNEFARALNMAAARAPRPDWSLFLNEQARGAWEEHRRLHREVLKGYGVSAEKQAATRVAPTTLAYTNHLLATAFGGAFHDSVAALLPCFWIYWEVGKALKERGSPDPVYRKWIETYADENFGRAVQAMLDLTDELARSTGPAERARMKELFILSSRYEWMFWEMAYQKEPWPPAPR
ncbi:MAG: thiaminase II [Acidobacteria bacterium]|nr:thiaminase II [Acidobacteriota bacterium]